MPCGMPCFKVMSCVWLFILRRWSMEKEMATHSSILAWKNPRTEESGGLKSMGLHDWACVHEGGGRWVGSNKLVELKKKIRQWSTTFLAAGMGFVEGSFSTDSGQGRDDSLMLAMGRGTWSFTLSPAASHLLCCLAPNRPQMGAVCVWGWGTPVLRQYLLACYYERRGWVLGQYPSTPPLLPSIFPGWWYQKLWLNQYSAFMLFMTTDQAMNYDYVSSLLQLCIFLE